MVILNRWGNLLMMSILWEDKSWEKWTTLQLHTRDITVLSVNIRQIMLPVTSGMYALTLVRSHSTAHTALLSVLVKPRCSPTYSVTQGRRLLCVHIALMFQGKKVILIDTLKDIIEIYEMGQCMINRTVIRLTSLWNTIIISVYQHSNIHELNVWIYSKPSVYQSNWVQTTDDKDKD